MQAETDSISIKHWSDEDKPREKFLYKGPFSVSNAELLAILIGTGVKQETAVDLAKRILKASNNKLEQLGNASVNHLMNFKGIGRAKAVTIAAALEIGRRRGYEKKASVTRIAKSEDVFDLLRPLLSDLLHEEFWILYLNNSNQVLKKARLSMGGITGTLVDTRLVMKQALQANAVAIVLSHNHPSGTLKPSRSDKNVTKKLCVAGKALDIKVLDHVIIANDKYFSFADNNLI
ncbi:RadC family protein [Eudoraea chungangensis]|uniref:RadC family protein n=1 Tax=Eudoraea chungangensis TaxID=1481905 RepID=UPI0023EDF972|nr:DNA repair protein RadC [Eudoraea chungangensis]